MCFLSYWISPGFRWSSQGKWPGNTTAHYKTCKWYTCQWWSICYCYIEQGRRASGHRQWQIWGWFFWQTLGFRSHWWYQRVGFKTWFLNCITFITLFIIESWQKNWTDLCFSHDWWFWLSLFGHLNYILHDFPSWIAHAVISKMHPSGHKILPTHVLRTIVEHYYMVYLFSGLDLLLVTIFETTNPLVNCTRECMFMH